MSKGFHAVLDPSTGFGGFGAAFLVAVADEYAKSPILLQAVAAPGADANGTATADLARNHAQTLASLHATVGLYIPATVPAAASAATPWGARFQVRLGHKKMPGAQ